MTDSPIKYTLPGYDHAPITEKSVLYKENLFKGNTEGWLLLKEAIPFYFGFADEWRNKMLVLGLTPKDFAPPGCELTENELEDILVAAVQDQSLDVLNPKTRSKERWLVSPGEFLLFLKSENLPMHPEFVDAIAPDGILPKSAHDASRNQLKNNIERIHLKRHPMMHLEALSAAIVEFWSQFDPRQPSDHAVEKTISDWIQNKYPDITPGNADAIAALSRHPKATTGRPKVVKRV